MKTVLKTPLETYLQENLLNEVAAINLLQGDGVISDNCIMTEDVAIADCQLAIECLQLTTAVKFL